MADSLQSNARSEITAGTGALLPDIASVANLRFYPAVRTVKAGSSLTWTNRDPETPHTVTFGTEPPADRSEHSRPRASMARAQPSPAIPSP
ncbi:MAG: hypothetical protein U0360_00715 [Dehalococcoidia bacterium]